MQDIESIVDAVKCQLTAYGLSAGTISMQYYGIYKPIINRHRELGVSAYSEDIVSDFLNEYRTRLDEAKVSRSHFATVRRAVHHLDSCAKTGIVDFSYFQRPLKVVPTEIHIQMVEECLKKLSSNDQKMLGVFMRHFFCFMEQRVSEDELITDDLVREFIIKSCALYSGSMGYIMRAVRYITAYLKDKGIILSSTDYTAFSPKAPRTKMQKPFSPDEVSALIDATDSTSIGLRHKAMLLLGYANGLRAGDIVNLKIDNIDWRKGELSIAQGKTGKPLKLSMNPTTMNAVAEYILKARPQSSLREIFLSVTPPYRPITANRLSVMIDELSEKSGVPKIPGRSFHGLRRSFAINLAEADISLEMISQMLGHTSYSTDRQYLTFNREQTVKCAMSFDLVPLTSKYYTSEMMKNGGVQ